jgi:hypothetical protein
VRQAQLSFTAHGWAIGMTAVALLAGCGGGGANSESQAAVSSANRMQKLAIVILPPPPPPSCTPTTPALRNIDFGQPGWTGGDETGDPVAIGTSVQASVSFTDVAGDVHSAQWSWGEEATTVPGTITEANGAGIATADNTYLNAGVYTVAVRISDACSDATASRQLVVYDPSAGFVTGGGWIDSPAGAYVAAPTLAGKANFGFVAKYLKGATVPIGQTEFQFQTANFNFHSESYDWLVVAGARAQFKGTGTMNGSLGYKFMLTAIDGAFLGSKGGDRFRIKIWHTIGGADVVDYDNELDSSLEGGNGEGTALAGGSIVIHK